MNFVIIHTLRKRLRLRWKLCEKEMADGCLLCCLLSGRQATRIMLACSRFGVVHLVKFGLHGEQIISLSCLVLRLPCVVPRPPWEQTTVLANRWCKYRLFTINWLQIILNFTDVPRIHLMSNERVRADSVFSVITVNNYDLSATTACNKPPSCGKLSVC